MKDNLDLLARDVANLYNKLSTIPVCTITLHSKLLHISEHYGYPIGDLLIFATDDTVLNDVGNIFYYYDYSINSVKEGLVFYCGELH